MRPEQLDGEARLSEELLIGSKYRETRPAVTYRKYVNLCYNIRNKVARYCLNCMLPGNLVSGGIDSALLD